MVTSDDAKDPKRSTPHVLASGSEALVQISGTGTDATSASIHGTREKKKPPKNQNVKKHSLFQLTNGPHELHADLVTRILDLLPHAQQNLRTALGQAEALESVGLLIYFRREKPESG
jgi:hypothetical protein